ncbi:MAG: beta-propeller domain-containing protein [Nanoarchaeota archaeon]
MKILSVLLILLLIAGCNSVIEEKPKTKIDLKESEMKKFSSYEELQIFIKDNVAKVSYGQTMGVRTMQESVAPAQAPSAAKAGDVASEYSQTNIQVKGVDEADIVKNDGKYIYVVVGNKISIIDAYPPENMKILSNIELDGTPTEIFVNDDKLAVFGNKYNYYYGYRDAPMESKIAPSGIPSMSPKAFIYVYDISDKENPELERNIILNGNYVDSRMIENDVYVILNSYINNIEGVDLPVIMYNGKNIEVPASEIYYFDRPDYSYQFTTILSIDLDDEMKEFSKKVILMGTANTIYVSLSNIYITYQRYSDYYDYTDKIIDEALIPNLPSDIKDEIEDIKTNTNKYERLQKISDELIIYMNRLSEEERMKFEKEIQEDLMKVQYEIQREIQKTIIHRISINEGNIEYEANGMIPGYLLNQFSMDEHDGYFRIATTTNNWGGGWGIAVPMVGIPETQVVRAQAESIINEERIIREANSLNHVYVLDVQDLGIVGRLENLAPNEQIYAARFLSERLYLVTFRRVDPLFVIDLSNPSNPEVLGKLKIPGFSDYLHPYDEDHIIGIGKEVREEGWQQVQGVKLGLFDVSDPSNPIEIAKYEIGTTGTDSEALREHKAFLFSKDKNILVIPILLTEKFSIYEGINYLWQGAYVFDVSLNEGFKVRGRVTHTTPDYKEQYYYFSPISVRRSLYMDDILYTISDRMVKANRLDNLEEINSVKLPYFEQPLTVIY